MLFVNSRNSSYSDKMDGLFRTIPLGLHSTLACRKGERYATRVNGAITGRCCLRGAIDGGGKRYDTDAADCFTASFGVSVASSTRGRRFTFQLYRDLSPVPGLSPLEAPCGTSASLMSRQD